MQRKHGKISLKVYFYYYSSFNFCKYDFLCKYFLLAKRLLELDGTGEKLAQNHVSNWDETWNNGMILVEGNDYDYNLQGYYCYQNLTF